MVAIGIDLGGTRIKWVTVDETGRILDRRILESRDWAGAIRESLHSAEQSMGKSADAIGLSAPGLAAKDGRSIAVMPGRLEGLENLDWTDYLQRSREVPVLNDAHGALVGEAWIGAAQGFQNVFLLTLGTGVGGAVMAEGRLLKGHIGRMGHLGHISLDVQGSPDVTGIPGSLEDAIGECTLRERSKNRYRTTSELVEAYQEGDTEAAQIWLVSIKKLACGIASLINVLDPEAVILGGGIAQAGKALFDPLQKHLDEIEWRPGGHQVKILPAELGEFAGAIGAARSAMVRRNP